MAVKTSFKEMLANNQEAMARQLIKKAYFTTQVSKICNVEQKEQIYSQKEQYLTEAMKLMPEWFSIERETIAVGNVSTGEPILSVSVSIGYKFQIRKAVVPANISYRRNSCQGRRGK